MQFSKETLTWHAATELRQSKDTEIRYQLLNDGTHKFLCSVPNITTSQDLASKEERLRQAQAEQDDALKASQRGWELLSGLEGACLYWISGWWSYEYCYSQSVRQFHALTPQPGVAMSPPKEDPNAGSYVLGQRPKSLSQGKSSAAEVAAVAKFRNNGVSKSLVVKFDRGTYCPLIGQERHVEIQFQCSPATNDHIAFVKEVSSCQYLLVVRTARLCHDVAFQEAAVQPSNSIVCSKIVDKTVPEIEEVAPSNVVESADDQVDDQAIVETEQDVHVDAPLDTPIDESIVQLSEQLEEDQRHEDLVAEPESNFEPLIQDSAAAMAKSIADQLREGTLTVGGKSIFDKENEDMKYNVELQTEDGQVLGNVQMSVVNGELMVELTDLSGVEQALDKTNEINKEAQEKMPDSVRKTFDEFVAHEEL